MQQKSIIAAYTRSGTALTRFVVQLSLSHIVACLAALALFPWLEQSGWPRPAVLVIALIAGGCTGVLLSGNILYGLAVLGFSLQRFATGQPVETMAVSRRWPLDWLFAHLNAVNQRLKEMVQQQRETTEFREQLLRQASEAAAAEERNHIARELHDSIKQQIFSISISAAAAKAHWDGHAEDARESIEDIQRGAKEVQVEMQALLQQLRSSPLENTSLADALRVQADALGYRTGARTLVEIEDLPAADLLPPGTSENIFRMVQEAFANIARHARAQQVELCLYQREHALHLEIRDDGQGFDSNTVQKGMGLASLRERTKALYGTIAITSAAGKGTAIHVSIPLLEKLHTAPEQERIEREIELAKEQVKNGFQQVEGASLLSTLLMMVSLITGTGVNNLTILIATGLCFLLAIYGYIQGRFALARFVLYQREDTADMQAIKLKALGADSVLSRLFWFGAWYLFWLFQWWHFAWGWWFVLGVTVVAIGTTGVLSWRRYHLTNRYYALQSVTRASWEVEQQHYQLGTQFRIWLITIIALLASRQLVFAWPTDWNQIAKLSILIGVLVWGAIMLGDALQNRRWRQRLAGFQTGKMSNSGERRGANDGEN